MWSKTLVYRSLRWLLLVIVLLLAVLVVGVCVYGYASLPKLDGSIAVSGSSALTDGVEIVRDAHGIPHILAGTDGDAYFALGFVHAQDRLWQLDIDRRIASGTLAEVLGERALPIDKFMRTLGVRRNAERIYRNLPPDSRLVLDRYAAGVNYYLNTRRTPLPIEYLLTHSPAPAQWTPADSVAWLSVLAWDLSGNMAMQIERMRLAQKLPLEQIHQLITTAPEDLTRMATNDYVPLYRDLSKLAAASGDVLASAPSRYMEGIGSNDWVVSGSRSQSGMPILANDPHLALSAPSLFYLAHLKSDRLNVVGGTVPGLPVVLIGRNEQIAWGFTNTGTSVEDLFIEQVNPGKHDQYRTPGGWTSFANRVETIRVKGQAPLQWTVRETRHGPVISDVSANAQDALGQSAQYVLALQWTALMPDDKTIQAGIDFNHANSWNEFLDAAAKFYAPQQNIVYADRAGNIGFIAPGRVPVRSPQNDLMTEAPALGWDARYDWSGFVPFSELPKVLNPPQGRIVTANNRIVANIYPHFLTGEWVLPYRYKRITALLDAQAKHSADSFATIQADIHSTSMDELLPVLLAQVGTPNDAEAVQVLTALKKWDHEARADRSETLIANAWEREATRAIFEPSVGNALFKEYWGQRNLHQALLDTLRNPAIGGVWCGKGSKSTTAQPCAPQIAVSLQAALLDLKKRYGGDMSAWRWGEAHAAVAPHRPFHQISWLARWFDVSVPVSGDMMTVDVGGNDFSNDDAPYQTKMAAALRLVVDMAHPEDARFVLPVGESGNRFSPWYTDMTPLWASGRYVTIPTDARTIEQCDCRRLRLTLSHR